MGTATGMAYPPFTQFHSPRSQTGALSIDSIYGVQIAEFGDAGDLLVELNVGTFGIVFLVCGLPVSDVEEGGP
jgi:hypothetical protein